MKKILRYISLVMAFFIIMNIIPAQNVYAASSVRYPLTEVNPEQFTSSPVLIAGLEKIISEYPVAFTKSGAVCSKSHSAGESNCLWFTPHQSYKKHNSRSTQCFGFANYVYETLFGEYWGFSQYFSEDNTLGATNTAARARSEFERLGVSLGTIVRSSSAGHSLVILDYDEDGVWIIHANYAGSRYGGCNTSVYYYTWDAYADAYGNTSYIIIPDSICENCVYTRESFPKCSVCSHRLNITENIYATYTAKINASEYFLPVDGMESGDITPAGESITVNSLFDVNGISYVRTTDGYYFRCEDFDFSGYLSSMQAVSAVYPDSYILCGKSFWLDGKVTSKNTITSLTVEVTDTGGTVVDTNTIKPNRLSVNIEDADTIKFSCLDTGYYTFRLYVSDLAEENRLLAESTFRVISAKTFKTAFPDKIFRQYLNEEIFGGEISDGDYIDLFDDTMQSVKTIDITSSGISSLGEIERFTSLETLYAADNHITSVDLSQNTALCRVDLHGQSVILQSVYDFATKTMTAQVAGEVFTYSRPQTFPANEMIFVSTSYGDMLMDVNITVNADYQGSCDINGDGRINSDDLSLMLMMYSTENICPEDVNFDGKVSGEDISLLITYYGR